MSLEYYETNEDLTFHSFDCPEPYQVFLYGDKWDIGGGTITKDEIDIIYEHPELERISIAGLHQDTFDYFVHTYGGQFKAIYFWKNKLVSDLSALSALENIEVLGYFANQRAEKLWDMSNNKKLRMLNIDDFSRLKDFNGIETAPALEGLLFGNKVWARTSIEHIPDLSHSSLKRISHNAEVSYEDTYRMLQIPTLEYLDFRANLYPTEFLAWICANFPHLKGGCLGPYELRADNSGFICGKRKPRFNDITEEKTRKKVENATVRFNEMKEKFAGVSFEEMMKKHLS